MDLIERFGAACLIKTLRGNCLEHREAFSTSEISAFSTSEISEEVGPTYRIPRLQGNYFRPYFNGLHYNLCTREEKRKLNF